MPQTIITIQKAKSNNYGHCTREKIWGSKNENEPCYEINIAAHSLHREVVDIVGTIYHEILHEYHNVNGIRGCNVNIHNKKFKTLAEQHGFRVEQSKQCGWGHTFVDQDTDLMEFINNEIQPNEDVFEYARIIETAKPKAIREKKTFKYMCPQCNFEAKAKADANLVCGNCEIEMEIKN